MNIFSSIPPAAFLVAGIGLALVGIPSRPQSRARLKKMGSYTLQASIVLLGAKIPIGELLRAGRDGLATTAISVLAVFGMGALLQRLMRIERDQAILISSGTAICGGSAIGAVAPTIGAKNIDVGVAIGVVFLLNAIAMVIFPPLGKLFTLNDHQFAYWAALAIHDTSSVVGASAQWSENALQMATTLKLSRTLWIFPVVLFFALARHRKERNSTLSRFRPPLPWFIAGFILMSIIHTYWLAPLGSPLPSALSRLSGWGFNLSLLFIGLSLSREQLKKAGARPLLYATALWLVTLVTTLAYVKFF